MVQASYAYSQAANDAEVALSLAVFADRPRVLAQLREDAAVGGFHVT